MPSVICSYEDFTELHLSRLYPVAQQLTRLSFGTYNRVSGYDNGDVETFLPNLRIQVMNGGFVLTEDVAHELFTLRLIDIEAALQSFKHIAIDATNAQSAVAGMTTQLSVADQNIFVLYVGVTAFSSAVELVRDIRARFPVAVIIVLSCECNTDNADILQILEIDYLVFTFECGGCATMQAMLEAFVNTWSKKR